MHPVFPVKGVMILFNKPKAFAALALILSAVILCGCYVQGEAAAPPASGDLSADTSGGETIVIFPQETPGLSTETSSEPTPGETAGADDGADGSGADGATGSETVIEEEEEEPEPPSTIVTITVSAAGDCTLGGDPRYSNRLLRELENNDGDHSYFLSNVRHIFEADDLTIINLEGPLTERTAHVDKGYVFRGPPHLAKILSSCGVEMVTLANNHIKDFLDAGYQDTVEALEAEDVGYFGNEYNTIMEINGIKVGMFGYTVWYDGNDNRNRIASSISDLQERGAQLIIAYFHWGTELATTPDAYQRAIARRAIDSGADLVLGAHPHVLQGIEVYNGKNIVYSLANFCFGGNNNPVDKDTMIFQQTFTFDEGVLQDTNETSIIPARVSSVNTHNDFRPTVAEGEAAERIIEKIQSLSSRLN